MKKKYWIIGFLLIGFFVSLYFYTNRERSYAAQVVNIKDSRDRTSTLSLSFFYPYLIDSIHVGPVHFNSDCLLRGFDDYPSWTDRASTFTDRIYHDQKNEATEVMLLLDFDYFLNFNYCNSDASIKVPLTIYRKKSVRQLVLHSYASNIDTEIR